MRQLGTSSCGGASSSVSVPAGGVPAGNTVVVVLVLRDTTPSGPVGVTDSRGNTYTADVDFTNSNIRKVIFSGRAATALQAGDTVTATHPDVDAEAVAVLEFSGIKEPRLDTSAANGGLSATPAVTATTTHPDDLLVGAAGNVGNRTYTEATAWTTVADVSTNCGGGTGRLTLHAAYRIVSGAAAWTYSPSLSANDRWARRNRGLQGVICGAWRPSLTRSRRSRRSSAPTTRGRSPTRASRSTASTRRRTSRPASRSGSGSPASIRSHAGSTPTCTAAASGRCASTRATPRRRRPTSASTT